MLWRLCLQDQSPPPHLATLPLSPWPPYPFNHLENLGKISLHLPLERPFPSSSHTTVSKCYIFSHLWAATISHEVRWPWTSSTIFSSPFVLNIFVILGMILQTAGLETLLWNRKTNNCFYYTLQSQHLCCWKANALTFSHLLFFILRWARCSCSSPLYSSQDLEMHYMCYDLNQAVSIKNVIMGSHNLAIVLS